MSGGLQSGSGTQSSAHIYDFATSSWSEAGEMSRPRMAMGCARANLAGRDVVVLAGGKVHNGTVWSTVDVFEILTETW